MTPGAFVESALYAGLSEKDLKDWDLLARVRYAVYRPGGPMAMELSKNPTVLIVNDTVFAHGGLLPLHGECGGQGESSSGRQGGQGQGQRGCEGEGQGPGEERWFFQQIITCH